MPNHVMNHVTVYGDKEQIASMLEAIKSDEFGLGSIDFNKIVPMPESLNMEWGSATERGLKAYQDFVAVYTFDGANNGKDLLNIPEDKEKIFLDMRTDISPEEWNLGRQAFRNTLQYGAAAWYDWCIENWGTKWNAYGLEENGEQDLVDESPTVSFQTAWSAPHPVLMRLAEMYPGVSFKHLWADENIGENCGRSSYEEGECTGVFSPMGKAAVQFANDVWDYDDIEEAEAFIQSM